MKPTAKKTAAKKAASKKAAAKKAATPASEALAEWTLLIYMAGDNDLDSFGGKDIAEMKTVGSSDKLHIIVQRDSAKKGSQATRMRVRKGTPIQSDVLESMGKINTGDPAVLEDFLVWGLTNYPAKRTMAVLWNHGSGWDDTDVYEEARRRNLNPVKPPSPVVAAGLRRAGALRNGVPLSTGSRFRASKTNRRRTRGSFFLTAWKEAQVEGQRRAIAFDDDAQDFLDSVEMKNVFANVAAKMKRPFDVIGMDACLMSMIETGLQVHGSGTVMCASQEIEPGDGWPYHNILEALAAKPTMDGKTLAALIAKKFVASYVKTEPVTQSACHLSAMQAVADAANALGSLLAKDFDAANANANPAARRALSFVRDEAQPYDHPDYVDLWDFADKLGAEHPPYANAAKTVKVAVEACVFANHAIHDRVKNSHGLSIYLPRDKEVSPLYKRLDFGNGGWASFLNARAARR